MKRRISVVLATIVLVILGVAPASAASQSGNISCGFAWTGQLTSKTSVAGNTQHSWTNNVTGSYKLRIWTSGGTRISTGYTNSHYVLVAPTIYSRSTTCIR